MATLLEKMDQQNEQLQLLTRQQAERVDVIALKQKETDGHIDAIKGDLDSVKGIMDGRMSAMEESIAGLKSFHAEIGEQQKSLKQELREELLQELATPISLGGTRLRPMAPPFVPSDATVGVACCTPPVQVRNRIFGADSIIVDRKSGTTLTVRASAVNDLYCTTVSPQN